MMDYMKSYINDVDWKYHLNIFKEGAIIVSKIVGSIIIVSAIVATLVTLFGFTVLPILFFISLSAYTIWLIGNISITKKKWDDERDQK